MAGGRYGEDMTIFDQFHAVGVIPVVEIEDAKDALPLVEALAAGGLPIIEITLRTEAALDAIQLISQGATGVIVGAGTVINREQAHVAVESGVSFLVSPGLPEEAAAWAQENSIPFLPGAVTPTEIIRAINLGFKILKFFPSETMGGLKAIKAVSDPFPGVKFIPTGGIRLENLAEYLQNNKIHAVGGSWLCKRALIANGQFTQIEKMALEATQKVSEIRQKEIR